MTDRQRKKIHTTKWFLDYKRKIQSVFYKKYMVYYEDTFKLVINIALTNCLKLKANMHEF